MAKKANPAAAQALVVKTRLDSHPELKQYGDNALPILGLALHLRADDMEELAAEAMTDGSNDKKIDFCHIDRTNQSAIIAQGYTSKERRKLGSNSCSPLHGSGSSNFWISDFQLSPQPGFPSPDASDKKFNSRLVAPTVSQTQIPPLVAEATGDGI
jgi:hypothetical protein